METLHGIVKLRLDQYNELLNKGSIQYGDKTIVYDPYVLYFTDEDVNAQITEGLEKIAEFEEGIDKTFLNTNHTESQEVNAEEEIIGNTINLHKVAKTGLYSDLIGKLEFASDNEAIAGAISNKVISPKTLKSALATVATGGVENIFSFRGTATTKDNLPQTLNKIGDVYYVKEGSTCYVWIEDEESIERWEEFGPAVDVSQFDIATTEEAGVVKSSNADLEISVGEDGRMSVNGLSNVIIETLEGTEDDPIDPNSLTIGRLYYLKGYILDSRSDQLTKASSFILAQRVNSNLDNRIICYGAKYQYTTSDGKSIRNLVAAPYAVSHTIVRINGTSGLGISKCFGGIETLNGASLVNFSQDDVRIYAPTTSGNAGQILQSNGNSAPTWIDMPETGGGTVGINIRRI